MSMPPISAEDPWRIQAFTTVRSHIGAQARIRTPPAAASGQEPSWHNPSMRDIPGEPLPVGATAPRFRLRRTFEETVDLADLLEGGPVVVVFYVFDFGDI